MKKLLLFSCCIAVSIILVAQNAWAAPFYSDKEWLTTDKKIVGEALKEWTRTDLTFREETDCTKKPNLTFVWKGEDVFRDWRDKGGPNRENALGWWIGAKPFPEWDVDKFPLGEIYLNVSYYPTKDRPGPEKFYVDSTPDNDEDDGYKKDPEVETYLTSSMFLVSDNFDLLTVIKHEIGHFLRLGHSAEEKNLMYGQYRTGVRIHPTGACK